MKGRIAGLPYSATARDIAVSTMKGYLVWVLATSIRIPIEQICVAGIFE